MNSDVTLMRRPRSHCCIAAEVATSEGLRCKRCSYVFLALCVFGILICEQHCKRIRLPSVSGSWMVSNHRCCGPGGGVMWLNVAHGAPARQEPIPFDVSLEDKREDA